MPSESSEDDERASFPNGGVVCPLAQLPIQKVFPIANRLAQESSPYLLQHANNPVDWYPWGAAALTRAQDEDRPIFLSIGYSACHWCHVMEHESFEDPRLAQLLNDNFISIKVDREERPDLDQLYMNAVMALRQGQGGWPLSVFLTPDQQVFYGGTYWPPTARLGMPGFDQVLQSVLDAFVNRRDQVLEQSRQITHWLNLADPLEKESSLDAQILIDAVTTLHRSFDFQNGGFGGAPKFPHATDLSLLIRLMNHWPEHLAPGKTVMHDMVQINLKKIAYGGIFDHLAGGFARYSVDEYWLVPHFEKMLYDNGLLACVYLEMFAETGDAFHAQIARKTLDYLLNYMTDDAGGFYSSEDADSEGVEGRFYVWSQEEIIKTLGEQIGKRFCDLYNVTESGNFEDANILNMRKSYQQFADLYGIDKEQLRAEMRAARKTLLALRDTRIRPGRDDKVLVSWNALAISAMAQAAVVLDSPQYAESAFRATEFILANMRRANGRLLHTWRNGQAKLDAFLDDYAFLIVALLDVYAIDFDQRWIQQAAELAEDMIRHFGDDDGGFFFTADDQEKLIARTKSFQDSSIPSGNAMASIALLRLGRLTGNQEWVERARTTIVAASSMLRRSPMAGGLMLIALNEWLTESSELVLVADQESDINIAVNEYRNIKRNGVCLIVKRKSDKPIDLLNSVLIGKEMVDGAPTLYVCSGVLCEQPVVGMSAIRARMQEGNRSQYLAGGLLQRGSDPLFSDRLE